MSDSNREESKRSKYFFFYVIFFLLSFDYSFLLKIKFQQASWLERGVCGIELSPGDSWINTIIFFT